MEYIERKPLPDICRDCTTPDCDTCDFGRERWILPEIEELKIKKKLKEKQLYKIANEIIEIEKQIAEIEKREKA